jgi:hypothetical protein
LPKHTSALARLTIVALLLTGCQTAQTTAEAERPPSATVSPLQPPRLGWPGADDTGVPDGSPLHRAGSMTVTKDGTVLEGLEIHGELVIQANDVLVRSTRVRGQAGRWGIIQRQGFSGLTVQDAEIFGNGTERTQFGVLNQGGMLTVRRVDIHTISNGILTSQGLVEDSYLHDPKYFEGDHTDMIMTTGGMPPGGRLVIRGNSVINNLAQTSAIALFQDFGVVRDVLIEDNFLAGGGYALYGGEGEKGKTSSVKVVDNVFSRQVWPQSGRYGPVAYFEPDGPDNEWRGNIWDDGTPISRP